MSTTHADAAATSLASDDRARLGSLVIAAVALKEGRDAWRGEGCCGPAGTADDDDDGAGGSCGTGEACC